MNSSTYPAPPTTSSALKGISPTCFARDIPERWIPSAAGPVRAASVRIHRPKPAVSRSVPLQQESTHPEPPNEPRLSGERSSQSDAVNAEVEVVMHTALARSASPPRRTDEEEMLQGFKCTLAHVEGALECIDECAAPLDQKVQDYKDQCAILAQCIQVQQKSWPGLADNDEAQSALFQTLARLEAGAMALRGMQQMALARSAYTSGFKAVSQLAALTVGGAAALNQLVDLLDVAADAFNVFTRGQPPAENELNELQKLRDALASSKLDFAQLAPPKNTAFRNALKLLGIPAIGKKQLQMALPTLHELHE